MITTPLLFLAVIAQTSPVTQPPLAGGAPAPKGGPAGGEKSDARPRMDADKACAALSRVDHKVQCSDAAVKLAAKAPTKVMMQPRLSSAAKEDFVKFQSAAISEPMAEAFSLLYEIAVDRAKRQGLEVVRSKIRDVVCKLTLPNAAVTLPGSTTRVENAFAAGTKAFPATCVVLTQSSLEQLAGNPQPLIAALGEDYLTAIDELSQKILTSKPQSLVAASLKEAIEMMRDALVSKRPGFTPGSAWVLLSPLLQEPSGQPSDEAVKIVKACVLLLQEESDQSCDVPGFMQLMGSAGKVSAASTGALAAIGVGALLSERMNAGVSSPDPLEQFRQAVRFIFGLAEREAPEQKANLRFVRDLALAAIDLNVPRMTSLFASMIEVNLPQDSDEKGALHKASAVLIAIGNYAATFEGKTSDDADGARKARKEVLEGLITATTVRTDRGKNWLFSLGAPVGFGAGGQWTRGASSTGFSRSWMPPQLEVPLGLSLQQLPSNTGWTGLHFAILAIDLGQFAAYDSDGRLVRPRWDSAISLGAQVGLIVGKPESGFVVGAELRFAPTLFATNSDLSPESAGAMRGGLFVAYYVPFFDFN